MTNAEKWRRVAEAFADAERDKYGFWHAKNLGSPPGAVGLCNATFHAAVPSAERDRIYWFTPPVHAGFFWSTTTRAGRDQRVLAACFLAAMAERPRRRTP